MYLTGVFGFIRTWISGNVWKMTHYVSWRGLFYQNTAGTSCLPPLIRAIKHWRAQNQEWTRRDASIPTSRILFHLSVKADSFNTSHLLNSQINEERRQPSESVRLIKGGVELTSPCLSHEWSLGDSTVALEVKGVFFFLKSHFRFGGNADDLCLRSLLRSVNESYRRFFIRRQGGGCRLVQFTRRNHRFTLWKRSHPHSRWHLQRQHFFCGDAAQNGTWNRTVEGGFNPRNEDGGQFWYGTMSTPFASIN